MKRPVKGLLEIHDAYLTYLNINLNNIRKALKGTKFKDNVLPSTPGPNNNTQIIHTHTQVETTFKSSKHIYNTKFM